MIIDFKKQLDNTYEFITKMLLFCIGFALLISSTIIIITVGCYTGISCIIKYIGVKIYKYDEFVSMSSDYDITSFKTWSKGIIPRCYWWHESVVIHGNNDLEAFLYHYNDTGVAEPFWYTSGYTIHFLRKSDQILYRLTFLN